MFANVVVLTYQAPDIGVFTYEIPKDLQNKLKVGQIVSVPFGRRNPLGVVLETGNWKLQTIKVKPISSVLFPPPILLSYQIKLLKWLSFYYHAPMVNCLEAMIPVEALKAKRLMTNANKMHFQSFSPLALDVKQTLILVPNLNRLPQTLALFPHAKNYAIYHSELKPAEKFATWLKILNNQVDFVFGLRSAIFAPCSKLEKTIIFNEHDSVYKDERSPYYDTLTVAEKICQLTGCQLQIIDSAPKITTYFVHKKRINLAGDASGKVPDSAQSPYGPHEEHGEILKTSTDGKETGGRTRLPLVKIVSMLAEKKAGNRSAISDVLASYFKVVSGQNKRILLFLNKKTESGHFYCRNCHHHEFATQQPEHCPNCQSADILFNSLNLNSLAALIKKLIPQAKINLIAEGLRPPNYPTTQLPDHPTIDIATATVFYKLPLAKYYLVAHVATDSLLRIPDFAAAEKAFQQIVNLKKLTSAILILQTYNPDNPTIKTAASNNYHQFFNSQLAQRKALSYPPFSLLVKLSLKDKRQERLETKSKKLFEDLTNLDNSLPATHYPVPTILGPYQPFFQKGTPRYNIVFKVPVADYSLLSREKVIKKILPAYLAKVSRDWQIVVEPANLN